MPVDPMAQVLVDQPLVVRLVAQGKHMVVAELTHMDQVLLALAKPKVVLEAETETTLTQALLLLAAVHMEAVAAVELRLIQIYQPTQEQMEL